jgi:hypothetical protein
MEPSTKDFVKFIKVFNMLAEYEAQQRSIRGYGCFNKDEKLPINEVKIVLDWLELKAKQSIGW